MRYAGFWRRAIAFAIDVVVIAIVIFSMKAVLAVLLITATNADPSSIDGIKVAIDDFGLITAQLFGLLYGAVMESSSTQGTLGKMAVGIKVTDLAANRVGFGKALVRNLCKIVSNLTFLVGYLMAGFTRKKQALHDKMSGCLILSKSYHDAEPNDHQQKEDRPNIAVGNNNPEITQPPTSELPPVEQQTDRQIEQQEPRQDSPYQDNKAAPDSNKTSHIIMVLLAIILVGGMLSIYYNYNTSQSETSISEHLMSTGIPSFNASNIGAEGLELLEGFVEQNRGKIVQISVDVIARQSSIDALDDGRYVLRTSVVECDDDLGYTCNTTNYVVEGEHHTLTFYKGNNRLSGYFFIDQAVGMHMGRYYGLKSLDPTR